ncbi:MAG: hypothetical protein LCH37_13090 [Bacteroidetes bacterium]|nr:hypothetical protein [Bacteroidota bacterium]
MAKNRETWIRDFVLTVESMRTEQKRFFATKQPVHLQNSKAYEKEVDTLIREFKLGEAPAPDSSQIKLFEDHG